MSRTLLRVSVFLEVNLKLICLDPNTLISEHLPMVTYSTCVVEEYKLIFISSKLYTRSNSSQCFESW